MRLIRNVKGISNIILILLLLVSFVVGALLSYIWTMGYYAPQEFHLPTQANVTIEKVEFNAQDATSFAVTVLNPSYSPSEVTIEQFMVATEDGLLQNVTSSTPPLVRLLSVGESQTFIAFWNWANYTGQTVNVIAFIKDGSGATFQKTTPLMNLAIASVNFDPSVSATNFTVTVQSTGSQTFMAITNIALNGENLTASPLLPYTLNADASATFTLTRAWSDLQGQTATVSVGTLQGFTAQKSQAVPDVLKVPSIVFSPTNTSRFNVTVQNVATPQTSLTISQIKVDIQGVTTIIEGANMTPTLPYTLQPGSEVVFMCPWNWSSYQGQGANATVTVYTKQGFSKSAEETVP